jgi:predicted metal-binding membrane protein
MNAETGLVRALTRERWIVGACLALACLFVWSWLFWQARQMSQPPAAMGGMGGMAAMATMGPAPGTIAYLASAFVMWAPMMVAMMLPLAAPMIPVALRASADDTALQDVEGGEQGRVVVTGRLGGSACWLVSQTWIVSLYNDLGKAMWIMVN